MFVFQVQRSQDRAFQSVVTLAGKKYRSSLWSVRAHARARARPHTLKRNSFNQILTFREKSKKFAEQAAAIVCLRVLGVPEGRIGEEDSGLVCKRKREARTGGAADEDKSKKRHVGHVREEEKKSETAVVTNGDHHRLDTCGV